VRHLVEDRIVGGWHEKTIRGGKSTPWYRPACAGDDSAGDGGEGIVGPTWQLQEFSGGDDELINPDDHASYTLTLDDDETANIVADCNQVAATYTLDDPS
jgi:heat shock protein HslJ